MDFFQLSSETCSCVRIKKMKLWNNANCSVTLQRGGGASSGLISSGLSGGSWEKKKKKKRKVVNTVKERCRPFGGWMKIQHDSGGNDAQ